MINITPKSDDSFVRCPHAGLIECIHLIVILHNKLYMEYCSKKFVTIKALLIMMYSSLIIMLFDGHMMRSNPDFPWEP